MFEDVFVASEALDWLHGFLKASPNFGADVTRQQAVQLCSKFLKNGIISDARGKQYNGTFEDNSHLYRFTDKARYSPYKTSRSPKNEKPLAPKSEKATALVKTGKLNSIYQDDIADAMDRDQDTCRLTTELISTSSVKGRVYNLRSNPLTTEPSRTPLVNKLNVLSATKIRSTRFDQKYWWCQTKKKQPTGQLEGCDHEPGCFCSSQSTITYRERNQSSLVEYCYCSVSRTDVFLFLA